MSSPAAKAQPLLLLPERAVSKAGYDFIPSSDRWELDKDVSIPMQQVNSLEVECNLGFRLALTRYAEEMSAKHASNMAHTFFRYLRDTGATEVNSTTLINWRGQLGDKTQFRLGALKGFLIAWNGWGFPGVSDDVVSLLEGWRIQGNEKGRAVAQGDPNEGPYSDLELGAILSWANRALATREIELDVYAYLLTLIMTARRTVQIAALRGVDLERKEDRGVPSYTVRFPRAKQRGKGFRQSFRSLSVIEDLYLTLRAQHQASVTQVENRLGLELPEELKLQIPAFINATTLDEIQDISALREILMGETPDRMHSTVSLLKSWLMRCEAACMAKSERTGERIHLLARRFRYTRGTNLRREGCGVAVIAEGLDQSDTQNAGVYTENTVQEAVIIDSVVGAKLAPFAQACMGTLVKSEREAIRGDDPRSRVPNQKQDAVGTCGNYGFCASGFRACYTCHHFQPWVDGPHQEVLTELYVEKQRAADAGCAREVVNANDRLILAVEHCVALCKAAKAPPVDVKAVGSLGRAVNDG